MRTATKQRPSSMSSQDRAAVAKQMQAELASYSDELDDETRAEIIGRFRNYSERNALLVVMQRPDASDVRGYNEWSKDGRKVSHGEKALKILAPAGSGNETTNSDGSKSPGRRYFKLVSVFDVSQTEDLAEHMARCEQCSH